MQQGGLFPFWEHSKSFQRLIYLLFLSWFLRFTWYSIQLSIFLKFLFLICKPFQIDEVFLQIHDLVSTSWFFKFLNYFQIHELFQIHEHFQFHEPFLSSCILFEFMNVFKFMNFFWDCELCLSLWFFPNHELFPEFEMSNDQRSKVKWSTDDRASKESNKLVNWRRRRQNTLQCHA